MMCAVSSELTMMKYIFPLQNSAQMLVGCCVPPTAFVLLVLTQS